MEAVMPAGKYVVAVSGGVDSMVLLDLLSKLPEVDLVVAHFDHGLRPESAKDTRLVKNTAKKYNLRFETERGDLKSANEETAREARYDFLNRVKFKYSADKIITAHHQDDWIETAFINILRGTGRNGLSSIAANPEIIRPLLHHSKAEILKYAKSKKLEWREDSTNSDQKYLRNYLRRNIMPKLSTAQRQELINLLQKTERLNEQINHELSRLLKDGINRYEFASLPVNLGNELLAEWLRRQRVSGYDTKAIQRLNIAIRTARPGTIHPIKAAAKLKISSSSASLIRKV